MTDRPWWATALQWTAWAVVMSLVMGWLGASRLRTPRRPGEMRHPPVVLILGLISTAFFGGIAVISNVVPNPTTTIWTTTAFVLFALASLLMVLEYLRVRHRVSDEGLRYSRLLGRGGMLPWSALRSVRYQPVLKWFRLETQSGEVVRVSVMLMGLPCFAALLLRHAPQAQMDEETRDVLQSTAAGHPPATW